MMTISDAYFECFLNNPEFTCQRVCKGGQDTGRGVRSVFVMKIQGEFSTFCPSSYLPGDCIGVHEVFGYIQMFLLFVLAWSLIKLPTRTEQ